jgi:ribosomal protein L37AE/L43A
MQEFCERYGTGAQCRAALQAARSPNGFVCPACGGAARTRFEPGGSRCWRCGACARQCSLISGTIFDASKLPLTRWFLAMQRLTQSKNNVAALERVRETEVSYRSA